MFHRLVIKLPFSSQSRLYLRWGCVVTLRIFSAGTAATYSTPVDLVKVQMQSQVWGPGARHTGTLAAFRNVYRAGGIQGLYTGVTPNVARAVCANSSQVTFIINNV